MNPEINLSSSFGSSYNIHIGSSQLDTLHTQSSQGSDGQTGDEAVYSSNSSFQGVSSPGAPNDTVTRHILPEGEKEKEARVVTSPAVGVLEEIADTVNTEKKKHIVQNSRSITGSFRSSTSEHCGSALCIGTLDHPQSNVNTLSHVSITEDSATRPLKRTSSSIRLSMSLEGKAEVIMIGNTPSPPRKSQAAGASAHQRSALQRSKSAVVTGTQSCQATGDSMPVWSRRSIPGRSRDARTWEFYCDTDARNALTVQAEQEQKGSAAGILSLIRSGSASSRHQKDLVKRKGRGELHHQRPKIARTSSSVARLQSINIDVQKPSDMAAEKPSKPESRRLLYREPSGDSDKENWEPGTHSSNVRRAVPTTSQRTSTNSQRLILQENNRIPSHSTSLGVLLNRESERSSQRKHKEGSEWLVKDNVGIDDEVSRFIEGSVVPREEVDLDCVQNLLSLSQGAWK